VSVTVRNLTPLIADAKPPPAAAASVPCSTSAMVEYSDSAGDGGRGKSNGRGGGGGGLVACTDADFGGGGASGVGGRLFLVPDWRPVNVDDNEEVEVRNANAPIPGDVALPLDVLEGFGRVGGSGSFLGVVTTGTSDDELTEPAYGGGGNTGSSSTSERDV